MNVSVVVIAIFISLVEYLGLAVLEEVIEIVLNQGLV